MHNCLNIQYFTRILSKFRKGTVIRKIDGHDLSILSIEKVLVALRKIKEGSVVHTGSLGINYV